MSGVDTVGETLEDISRELERRGQADIAERVDKVIAALQGGTVLEPTGGVLTTGEAARMLGIRSINTIKRWAGDGLLEGFRRGGRVMVSRRSVERMLESPTLARQKDWERGLGEALDAFEAGDGSLRRPARRTSVASRGTLVVAREPDESTHIRAQPIIAVVDSNVFARRRWIEPIVDSAAAVHLVPIWSPCIIEETSRLLTWLWLKRNGGATDDPARRRHATIAHAWFDRMSTVFRVVDDRPPLESMWLEPRDPRDAPIWTAAVRANAGLVVTENLKDGPPADHEGRRRHGDVDCVHPRYFAAVLDAWGHVLERRDLPALDPEPAGALPPSGTGSSSDEELTRTLEPDVQRWFDTVFRGKVEREFGPLG